MNRAQRRATAKATRPLEGQARDLAARQLEDRLSWTAAAYILQRVVNDPAFDSLDNDLKGAIVRFLERHQAPVKMPDQA